MIPPLAAGNGTMPSTPPLEVKCAIVVRVPSAT